LTISAENYIQSTTISAKSHPKWRDTVKINPGFTRLKVLTGKELIFTSAHFLCQVMWRDVSPSYQVRPVAMPKTDRGKVKSMFAFLSPCCNFS